MKTKLLDSYSAQSIAALVALALLTSLTLVTPTHADSGEYKITIQNISNTIVTPPAVALSKNRDAQFFTLGEEASEALEILAEGGNTTDWVTYYETMNRTSATAHDAPLMPGASTELRVSGNGNGYLYLGAMLLPTNDAFTGLNGVAVKGPRTQTFYTGSYDAGTEANTETNSTIPGPFGGEGYNADRDDVNFVHPHPGLHGNGDIDAGQYNWQDPVLKVTIERI